MHFSVERDLLVGELNIAKRYLTKLVPALSNFLIEADDKMQQITISASDTKNHFVTTLPAQVKKSGSYIFNAAVLLGGAGEMPAGKWLHFKEEPGVSLMTCEKTKLKIPTSNAGGFVPIPLVVPDATLEIVSDDLSSIVRATTFARLGQGKATQQTDFKWEALSIKVNQGMALFTCSDRHRVAFARHQFNQPVTTELLLDAKSFENFIVGMPPSTLVKLELNTQQGRIALRCGNRMLIPATLADKYVDVLKFVPVPTAQITAKREELMSKLEIALLVRDEVDLKAKGKTLSFETSSPGTGEYADSMTASVTAPMDVTLKVPYLLEGLKKMDSEDVEIRLAASDKPAIIAPKGKSEYAYLLMPIA